MDNKAKIFLIKIAVLVAGLVAIGFLGVGEKKLSTKYDAFAQCLGEKGAIFYGAFWCPHCANQKELFGDSARLLPYVECSTPDGRGQTQECRDKNIDGYPTWEFADGSRQGGEVALETLAEKTSCELPSDSPSPEAPEPGGSSSATPTE